MWWRVRLQEVSQQVVNAFLAREAERNAEAERQRWRDAESSWKQLLQVRERAGGGGAGGQGRAWLAWRAWCWGAAWRWGARCWWGVGCRGQAWVPKAGREVRTLCMPARRVAERECAHGVGCSFRACG
jgi:hypothetical protein